MHSPAFATHHPPSTTHYTNAQEPPTKRPEALAGCGIESLPGHIISCFSKLMPCFFIFL